MTDHFKKFSTLQATAAIRGLQLRAIQDDCERYTFVVTGHGVSHELPSLDAVAFWLEQGWARTGETSEA